MPPEDPNQPLPPVPPPTPVPPSQPPAPVPAAQPVHGQPAPSPVEPPSPEQQPEHHEVVNPLQVMQPGEQVLFELKRHPIGLFISYILTGIILIALGTIAFVVAPNSITGSSR